MPTLRSPEWLLLLPALALLAWYWRAPRLTRPLRAVALVLLVLALSGPRLAGKGEGLDLWVLVDRSASARDLLAGRLDEMEGLLASSRARDDRLIFVDFAEEAQKRGESDGETFAGGSQETRVATAVRYALSSMDPNRSSRVLLLTDGYATEPLDGLGERLSRQGVPLDLRLLAPSDRKDFGVVSVDLPARGRPMEPFAIEARFRGDEDRDVPFVVTCNGATRGRGTASIRDGSAVVRFADRLPVGGGALRYRVRLEVDDDFPGNDEASGWIEIDSGPRTLVVTAYANDPMIPALQRQGLAPEVVTEPRKLTLGDLAGVRSIVIDNVPASELSSEFLKGLDAWVRVQGGGLLMTGGEYSFGSGGYFRSPVDPLLPVSMELREEHRVMSVAMAIVMDRSGSMSASVTGGRSKMDLANEGAARSIELLGPRDSVAVFAVDSSAHSIVPLTPLGDDPSSIVDPVRRINSTGGGIYVYEGLSAAWEALKGSVQGQRHVILFADAADSEEPGEYRKLLDEMVAANTTVSVIGLGSEEDSDAALLRDIAARGKGRIFFNADPATLPALFAQETVAVARSAFIDEPVGASPTSGWLGISRAPIRGLDVVDGYNLSYLREDATEALVTTDEYEAPLVAFWSRGAGRAAAVSFPLGGPHSARARAWPGYADFLQTLSRWLVGEDVPPGLGLETRLDGNVLGIDLTSDESWDERLAASPAEVLLVDAEGQVESLVWERLEPGRFHAARRLAGERLYRGAVRVGGTVLPFGPIAAPGGAEWSFDRERVAELRALSVASGGVERTELGSVWDAPVPGSDLDLAPALVTAFLVLFLLEAFLFRAGYRFPEWGLAGLSARLRAAASRPAAPPSPPAETPPAPPEPAAPEPAVAAETASDRRRTRFERAKRGR